MKKFFKKLLSIISNPIRFLANYQFTDKIATIMHRKPWIIYLLGFIIACVVAGIYISVTFK